MVNLKDIAELSPKVQKQMQARCNYDNSKRLKRKASAMRQIEAGKLEGEIRCN